MSFYELPGMNFGLGETADMITDMVKNFANENIAPRAAQIDQSNQFPRDLWPMFGDLGLLGITVPEEFGGAGLGYLEHCLVNEQISRASASVGLSYGAHSNLCVNQINRNGTKAQKLQYLPKLISGEHVGALAMSEPNAGSDVVSMKLRADKKADHYLLNGNKMWITNGPEAETLVVYAKTAPELGAKGITAFIVEKGLEGFTVGAKENKLGIRASDTHTLLFNDVKVPKENRIGEDGFGFKFAMTVLSGGRIGIASQALGIASGAYELALAYS